MEVKMEFKIEQDRKLFCLKNKMWIEVDLKPCFPNSHPDRYFSVRDSKGNELFLIKSLQELDVTNRELVREYLGFKNFIFEVEGFYAIDEDFGLRNFKVATNKGDRIFQTALDDWPRETKDGSALIECLHGEQYLIKDLKFGSHILNIYL